MLTRSKTPGWIFSRAIRVAVRAAAPGLGLLALAAFAVHADAPRARPAASTSPPPKKPARPPPPLSAEDAALVREMALVENAELLKNLELFEAPEGAQAQASPPAPNPAQPR